MNKIILALDTSNLEEAINITKQVEDKIFTVKLGLEFFSAHGKKGIKKFNEIGITNAMLDLKLKDIGQTVYKAIKALDDIEFGFLTIHGQGGKAMIDEAKKAANEIKSKPKIMMVTILTSLNDGDLKDMGDQFRKTFKASGVALIGTIQNNKPMVMCAVTDDLTDRIKAGKIVQEIGSLMGGGGGGKPHIATAVGKNIGSLEGALSKGKALIKSLIKFN